MGRKQKKIKRKKKSKWRTQRNWDFQNFQFSKNFRTNFISNRKQNGDYIGYGHIDELSMGCLHQVDIKRCFLTWYTVPSLCPPFVEPYFFRFTKFPISRSVCGCSSERGVTNRYRALMPCHSGMKLFETPSPSSRLLIHIWMPNKRKN